MFADKEKQKVKTNFSISKNSTDDLMLFIQSCLTKFPEEYKKIFHTSEYIVEPVVSAELSKILECKSRENAKPYVFTHQYPQSCEENKTGKYRDVDIDVCLYLDRKTIFAIECKWLRNPVSKSKQYVSGNTGGIERFKREQHGGNLPQSAIVGFIENEEFDFWFKTINNWITELFINYDTTITWEKSDLLNELTISETTAKYQSNNKRSKDYIVLTHLWVILSSAPPTSP